MKEIFKKHLYDAAEKRIKQQNFNFNSLTSINLKAFIDSGVDKMSDSDLADANRKSLAEINLVKLIDAMAKEGIKRSLTESLDSKTFSDARFSLCPLWPFC